MYDGTSKAQKSFVNLSKIKVLVGVPEAGAARLKGVMNNATLTYLLTHGVRDISARIQIKARMLNRKETFEAATAAYIHTHGSIQMQIPPRPIIEPAIEFNQNALIPELRRGAEAGLAGDKAKTVTIMKRVALMAQNFVRGWFTNPANHWAPNAPSTIKRKGSSRPNIDTGELRKSMIGIVSEES